MTTTPVINQDRRWRVARSLLAGFVGWTLIAVFFATQTSLREPDKPWSANLPHSLATFYVWGLLTIGIAGFTARVGVDRYSRTTLAVIYLIAGLVFSFAHVVLTCAAFAVLGLISGGEVGFTEMLRAHLLRALHSNMLIYTVITAVCLAVNYYRKFQERELRASKLEAQLTQAQLNALKSQLQPHFLFNTLNAIAALVRENPDAAERMIVRLSDLLRAALEQPAEEEVPLCDELEFARRYLEIEQMRFGERLQVEEDVAPETQRALVPSLLLQPLVENAMRHAVGAMSSPCLVKISATRSDHRLHVEVNDTGPGQNGNGRATQGAGVGIANTVDRLRHLYGSDYRFTAGDRPDGGYGVSVELPYREGPQSDEEGV